MNFHFFDTLLRSTLWSPSCPYIW